MKMFKALEKEGGSGDVVTVDGEDGCIIDHIDTTWNTAAVYSRKEKRLRDVALWHVQKFGDVRNMYVTFLICVISYFCDTLLECDFSASKNHWMMERVWC